MARNRQRAKERQARRKAQEGPSARPAAAAAGSADGELAEDRLREEEEVREAVDLEVGAPPQDLGRSDEVIEDEPDLEDEDHYDPAEDQAEDDEEHMLTGPRGHRGEEAEHKDRPRFVQFLIAVRAELARVQWPDRQALTTLTGVVLGFVLIAGGYLGLLDAIVSRIMNAIL